MQAETTSDASTASENRGQFHGRRKIIDGGYSKKGDAATSEDALALGLLESDHNKIYICDRYEHLTMFHVRDDYETQETDPEAIYQEKLRVSAVRGWIYDNRNQRVVCRSFTETSIFFSSPEALTETDWSGWTFKPYIEGTTIRIFWDGFKWMHSTHRKIDCRTSRIPGAELEIFKIFQECLPTFDYKLLDKEIVYILQIVHQENQVMNPLPVAVPHIYHLASYRNGDYLDLTTEVKLPGGETHYPNVIPGCIYAPDLILENAQALLAAGWCCIVRNGSEIVQLAAPGMEFLMKIRGYDSTPYIPPELMYLRLSPEDRPYLAMAAPYHLKERTNSIYMEPWIRYNSNRLALFCAQNLQAKIEGNGIVLTKTLTWLLKNLKVAPGQNMSVESMHAEYQKIIDELCATKGDSIYRCFRDMDSVVEKVSKLFTKHMAAQVNPTAFQEEVQEKTKPSRNQASAKNKNHRGKRDGERNQRRGRKPKNGNQKP